MGRKAGWRGAAWGAALGTLPDLDILAYPFLDSVGQLAFHRGITHSILFCVVLAPLFGRLLARLHRARGIPVSRWSLMVFLVLFTHIALDAFTVYGTQVFQPFSDYPLALNSLFIIDPLYTAPLAISVVALLFFPPESRTRRAIGRLGLLASTLYVVWSLGAKAAADRAFEQGWAEAGIQVERAMSNPLPLNTVLWMGIAESRDTLHVGVYSLLDPGPPTSFVKIPKRNSLVAPYADERAVRRLLRFSKGWYGVTMRNGSLVLDDWRFGRGDAWLGDSGDPIFRFVLERGTCPDSWCGFRQESPALGSLGAVWDRIGEGS